MTDPVAVRREVSTRPDPIALPGGIRYRPLAHRLWVHPDVFEGVGDRMVLRKRLGIVLQHLAAHGRTSVVKACADPTNRGWWRSPLGGNRGIQYYLWWASQGARPVKDLAVESGHVLVRAVRHHDDHAPLDAGSLDDYLALEQPELTGEGYVERPWTAHQLDFVQGEDPVRFVVGRPGAGKTTVLWNAIEARADERVLYLTWSRELLRTARERLHAFAGETVEVETRDFSAFLSELVGRDVRRLSLFESQARLRDATLHLAPSHLGVWSGRERALHAELRAFLFGRALPGEGAGAGASREDAEPGTEDFHGLARLTDEAYLARRGGPEGVGPDAARALLAVTRALDRRAAAAFPELAAARAARERLRQGKVPAGFRRFDRVVVDEAQDLTLLELSVVTELCRSIAIKRGVSPWLLLAGDEGQTVRPSGFAWGPVSDLVAARVGTPRKFPLDENLRCPARIAAVIDRASAEYVQLEKGRRPAKQRGVPSGQHVDAHLLQVVAADGDEALHLVEELGALDRVVVLSPDDEPPGWLTPSAREVVLTPAEAKGLEYQAVCVLGPGRGLRELQERLDDPRARDLEEHAGRTMIDQLRVALSRATETLAFLDVAPTDEERELGRRLLGDPVPFEPADLLEHLTRAAVPIEERVMAMTTDARALVEERPARAWSRALQAVRLLGDPELPGGVADPRVRAEASDALLAVGARLLIEKELSPARDGEVSDAARGVLAEAGLVSAVAAWRELVRWSRDRTCPPFDLLDAVLELEDEVDDEVPWLRDALVPVALTLRRALEELASDPAQAPRYDGSVEEWLELTGLPGDGAVEARRLRIMAAEALLEVERVEPAKRVMKLVDPPEPRLHARLLEARGRFEAAAGAFHELGADADALRCWRAAGEWDRARTLLADDAPEARDLDWLRDIEARVAARPAGMTGRITPAERRRLGRLLRRAEEGGAEGSLTPRAGPRTPPGDGPDDSGSAPAAP